jgi:hypothetical protein
MNSLGRITKHLPNTTLDDPLSRVTIDARGRVWVNRGHNARRPGLIAAAANGDLGHEHRRSDATD